jgi:carboxylesterase type B
VGDASFACPALQIDQQTAPRVPTYAYEFNDDTAPQLYVPPGLVPPVATHGSELPYLFDLPNAPFPATFSPSQQALAASCAPGRRVHRHRDRRVSGSGAPCRYRDIRAVTRRTGHLGSRSGAGPARP